MSDNNNNNKYHIPSELRISKQWDAAIEQTLVNTAIGATAAGLASIVLFRGRGARVAFTAFGVGFGAGIAYKNANIEFEKEKKGGNN